jgi:hypothetical protein
MPCTTLILAATSLLAATMPNDAPKPLPTDLPAHARCAQVRAGMNYREALALFGRAPDSTLSGHTAAGPSGEPPGSFAIDFWYDTDGEGRRLVSTLRYQGGMIESVDCGRPVEDHATPPAPSAAPGT